MNYKELIARIRGESVSVGLDIGHHSVKMVVIEHTHRGKRLIGYGIEPIASDIIVDGSLVLEKEIELTGILTTLINQVMPNGLMGGVISGVNWTQGVVGDRLKVEIEGDSDPEDVILMRASKRPPFDEQDVTLDYTILKSNNKQLTVLLVAAKNAILSKWGQFHKDAGLPIYAFDPDAIAGVNALLHASVLADFKDEAVGVVNIGDAKAHLTIVKDGLFHSVRELQNGSFRKFTLTASRYLNTSKEEAVKVLKGEAQENSYDKVKLNDALDHITEDLSVSIDLAIQYYRSVEKQEDVNRIVLIGGGANISSLMPLLSEKLDMPVDTVNPFKNLDYDPELASEVSDEEANCLYVALGRALRKI